MNTGKRVLLMLSIWSHKILKLPIVLDPEKYVETQQLTSFIMVKQAQERILQNGLKVTNYKVLCME
jgi:hypothetical protein